MSFTIAEWDYGFAIRTICGMVGHPIPADAAGSPDPAVVQMGLAVNNALGELLAQRNWQELTKRGSIPIVADYAGQKEKAFPLPVDFLRFVDETQWSNESFLPAPGPVSAQEWMVAMIQSVVPAMALYWQIRDGQLYVMAPPYPAAVTYEFFYISRGQVVDQDEPDRLKNVATKNGDKFKLDGYLVTLLGRVKYLEWKGFDASAAMRDFQIALNERAGANKGARTLSLSRNTEMPFISVCNVAGPLGGGGSGSVDLSNYYTKAEADAAFLTQAEADVLYLTPAQAALTYLTKAQTDTYYEPKLGNPASDGQVLSSTAAGARSWITPTGGGGPVAASSVTNTPAGNIAATNVQAALNELDGEKAPLAHTHVAGAVTNTPAGNIAATDVQAALNELDAEKAPLASPTFTGLATFAAVKETPVGGGPGTSYTVNLALGTNHIFTTSGNTTFTLPTPSAGRSFTLDVLYGGAGHTLTWVVTGGALNWPGGTPPTPTSATGKRDKFAFQSDPGGGTNWFGSTIGLNYAV